MVWRDRLGGFDPLLDYNWIEKGGEVAVVWPLGSWGVVITQG